MCSVGVDCMTAPTPPPSPTHHPSSQCSVDCMTDILPPPPPPTHTHTDIAQPPRAVLTARLSCLCVCAAPAVLTFQRTAPSISENRCTNSAHETSSSTAVPGPMTGLSIWTALTAGHRPWTAKHSDNCCEIYSHAEIPDETVTEILVSF